jgi:trans-aconitate methyltransferase
LEEMWTVRARSFEFLLSRLHAELSQPLTIVDLGAGNGWLSYQLSRRGHQLYAIDLTVNDFDGLGTHTHYDMPFTPVQAEFNRLPFPGGSIDLIISNAAFHYSTDYGQTLTSLMPLLKPAGQLILLDTPFYHDSAAGQKMVHARHQHFAQNHGRRSDNLPHENFMTLAQLEQLAAQTGCDFQIHWPDPAWRRRLRRWRSRWQLGRESAQFPLVQLQPRR